MLNEGWGEISRNLVRLLRYAPKRREDPFPNDLSSGASIALSDVVNHSTFTPFRVTVEELSRMISHDDPKTNCARTRTPTRSRNKEYACSMGIQLKERFLRFAKRKNKLSRRCNVTSFMEPNCQQLIRLLWKDSDYKEIVRITTLSMLHTQHVDSAT